jgi:hypothetical protein
VVAGCQYIITAITSFLSQTSKLCFLLLILNILRFWCFLYLWLLYSFYTDNRLVTVLCPVRGNETWGFVAAENFLTGRHKLPRKLPQNVTHFYISCKNQSYEIHTTSFRTVCRNKITKQYLIIAFKMDKI